MRIFLLKAIFLTVHCMVISNTGFGQTDTLIWSLERELMVAVHPQAPYVIEGEDETWDGLSIQLWRQIAENLQIRYRLVSMPADAQHQALQRGEIDVILLANANTETDKLLDFSHFYHTTKLGVALPQNNDLSSIVQAFFSRRFWQIVLAISVLLLIVGTLIYFIERGGNEDHFGGKRSVMQGIGSGFWWAGVTMTTIGYGDKAPTTFFGRAVALMWMLIAMAVTSVLTAGIVSAMGGSYTKQLIVPEDLHEMKVAAVAHSPSAAYLHMKGINFQPYAKVEDALKAVENEAFEVVVSNTPLLKHAIDKYPETTLEIQAQELDPQYYGLGLRKESVLRKPLNQALLQIIKTDQWQEQLKRYVPEPSDKK